MLKTLTVKNFAIIEDLTINFNEGMTVLTGQTGAGKSLIIDTINLLLGQRADSDMIRYGSNKAFINGIFDYKNNKIDDLLKEYNIPKLEDLNIYREISINGKNIIKINEVSVNLNILKNISIYLADIHVQHDTFRLINPDNYLSLIDNLDNNNFNELINEYVISLDKYERVLDEYNDILKKKDSSRERLDFIIYEHNEIKALNLEPDKDIKLREKISKLSNYDKIYKGLNEAYSCLENEYFSIDNIYNAYKSMDKISEFDESYKESKDRLSDAFYTLDDIKSDLYKAINNLDFDDFELNSLTEELNNIESVCKKYNKNVNDLILYDKKIELEIELATNYDEVLKEKRQLVSKAYKELKNISEKITSFRKKEALKIEEAIINECRELELEDINFKIEFNDPIYSDELNNKIFNETGVDVIDFMISLNKGEPLKPLHKTASGGELSRIMLAFKAYFSKNAKLSLMIFDEIDTGVSGSAAYQIAKKMKNISKYTQVLCITHLPQVAAICDNHLWIYKELKSDRTITCFEYLDYESRVNKLAIMMSGQNISKYSLDVAREMLNSNN